MAATIKKIIRLITYGGLIGVVGLLGFIVSKKKSDHSLTLNPLSGVGIPAAYADHAPSDTCCSDGGDCSSG